MKTIAFYNEKGGVGKSTFSIMYASWLHYKYGIKVAVADFNGRLQTYKTDEINEKKSLGIMEKFDNVDQWPIVTADKKTITELKESKISLYPNITWLENEIHNGGLKDHDVVILDLPGATAGEEFSELSFGNMIGLLVMVTDRDPQTIRATLNIVRWMRNAKKNNMVGFINQAQTYVTKEEYKSVCRTFTAMGLNILPDMVSFSERVRKINGPEIMRSALEYPNWDSPAFEGARDLGIDNLFIDVTRELAKQEDIKKTPEADLSFVDKLRKEFQERRQLTDTAFPEYEFDKSMFKK